MLDDILELMFGTICVLVTDRRENDQNNYHGSSYSAEVIRKADDLLSGDKSEYEIWKTLEEYKRRNPYYCSYKNKDFWNIVGTCRLGLDVQFRSYIRDVLLDLYAADLCDRYTGYKK